MECLLSSGRSWTGNSGMSTVKWEDLIPLGLKFSGTVSGVSDHAQSPA